MMDGLVVVDKPAGFTSHDVVAKLRKAFGQKRVGHAGTLDPDATGVLLVGLGRVTRLLRFLQETTKTYRGTIAFGVATDTLDAAGAVLERRPMPLTEAEVVAASLRFVGELQQVPPMVSALKVGGRRLHELARAGEEVERKPRSVRIDRFDIESFEPGPFPQATVLVECSSGTYIRSLAADLGAALGGPAHLAELRRLRVGSFTIDESHPLDEIEADPPAARRQPGRGDARTRAGRRGCGVGARGRARLGLLRAPRSRSRAPGPYAVVDEPVLLLAVYERRGAGLKPSVVLPPAEVSGS